MIKNPNELSNQIAPLSMLLFGQPGIGKTTFGLSSPNSLIIDTDNGMKRINPIDAQDYIYVQKWIDVLSILDEDLSKYQIVIIDTVGMAVQFLIQHLMETNSKFKQSDGSPSLKCWGAANTAFETFHNQLKLKGKNILLICHDKEDKKGEEQIVRPDVNKGTLTGLNRTMDLIAYMESINNKRTINYGRSDRYYTKNTCNLPANIEIGDYRTSGKTFKMSDVIKTFTDNIANKQKISRQYNEMIADTDLLIDNIDSTTKADDVLKTITDLKPIWDSTVKAKAKLQTKVKELGFAFDTKTKKFTKAETVKQ